MTNGSYLLIEDSRVKSIHASREEAAAAMAEEHKRDLFGLMLKKWLLKKYLKGKYQLKRYVIVRVTDVRVLDTSSDLKLIEGSDS